MVATAAGYPDCTRYWRRVCLYLTLAIAAAFAAAQPAAAGLEEDARAVVEQTSSRLVDIVTASVGTERKNEEMERLLEKYTDIESISATVLGRAAWRSASKAQQEQFVEAFRYYLARKYTKYFPNLLGREFEIVSVRRLKKNYAEVTSRMYHLNQRTETVSWFVLERNGKSKIYNLVVGDLNMLYLERTLISNLLEHRDGDLDKLIAYLPRRML